MKHAHFSGLNGADASNPAASTSTAVTIGGASSVQAVSHRPKQRSAGQLSGGFLNQAAYRMGRK